jgi:tetratricopeptide (TPR) repeat protein
LYAQILERNKETYKAIEYYEKAYINSSHYNIALRLGICYMKTNQFHKAKEKLEFVRLQLPYLLRPKILLMNLYHRMGDLNKAKDMAKEIINTTVKIENAQSNKIKKTAINYLKRIKKHEKN